ncbi:MAG: HEAT repeat domain-containing protein [Chloroflexota bacterium]
MAIELTLQDHLERLQDTDPATRASSVHAIGQLREPSAISALIWLMGDDSLWVRCTAAEALGEYHSQDVVEPLVQFLRMGANAELDEIGPPPEVPIRYHRFNRHPDPDFERWRTEQGLKTSEGFSLVVSARIGLQKTGIAATEALIRLLRDQNPYVQYVAVYLLNKMAIRKRPSDALLIAVMDDNPTMRLNAARALGKTGNFRAVRPLISLLHDESLDIRIAAAEALGEIQDKRAAAALTEALDDPEVHHAAWLALHNMQVSPDEDTD